MWIKKTLHEPRVDYDAGQLRREGGADGLQEYPRGDHPAPGSARGQQRREILLRVVRISETLNQRLAL